MKKSNLLKWGLFLKVILFINVLPVNAEQNNDEFLFQQLNEAYVKMAYFTADFTQQKSVKFLSEPLVSEGRIEFVKNQGLVWEINSPVWVKTTITDAGVFKSNQYQKNKVVKDVQMQAVADMISDLFNAQLTHIQSRFNVNEISVDKANKQWQVSLEPRSKLIKKALQSLTITGHSDGQSKGISELRMIGQSENETLITFSATEMSETVPDNVELNDF